MSCFVRINRSAVNTCAFMPALKGPNVRIGLGLSDGSGFPISSFPESTFGIYIDDDKKSNFTEKLSGRQKLRLFDIKSGCLYI